MSTISIADCQEQIELSGFVTRELSAFLFRERGDILEQEGSGGRALPQTMRRQVVWVVRTGDRFFISGKALLV